MNDRQMYSLLLKRVEQRAGRMMLSPKDFIWLARQLPQGDTLSVSTLKRLWQYVPSSHAPREETLNILSRFVGYCGWTDFCLRISGTNDSGFLADILMAEQIGVEQEMELAWRPDRLCRIKKQVNGTFVVVESHHCKLQIGDVFAAAWFSVGQPLYVTKLQRNGIPLPDYVAGRKEGLVRVSLL